MKNVMKKFGNMDDEYFGSKKTIPFLEIFTEKWQIWVDSQTEWGWGVDGRYLKEIV